SGAAAGNGGSGIFIDGTANNSIGSPTGSGGNGISANGQNGVLIAGPTATGNVVAGNFIGTNVGGTAAVGNGLDGVRSDSAGRNLIGHSDPVTGVTYYNADAVSMQPVSGWQGIRASDTSGQYLISGTSDSNGLLFEGTMAGVGMSYSVNYPGALASSVY